MSEPTTAQRTREVRISADSHVAEPFDLWETRLPEALRDRALRFPDLKVGEVHHTRAGGWDPKERLKDMALDGISAEVLYPSLGLGAFRTQNPILAENYARVYNDWLIEYCREAPDRLWGQAVVPLWNVDWAVTELERCRNGDLRGATTWLVPPDDLPFYSDHYERFWAAAQDLGMPVSMHINAGPPVTPDVPMNPGVPPRPRPSTPESSGGARRLQPPNRPHRNLLAAMNALSDIIASGVLERYPGVNVVIAEVGVGWIPYWLEEEFDRREIERSGQRLSLLPSEYFYRQGHATFLDDAVGAHLLTWRGTESFMWSNDYPHQKCIWPFSEETIARTLGDLPEDVRSKAVCHNAARLYGMPVPAPMDPPAEPPQGPLPSRRWEPFLATQAHSSSRDVSRR